MKTLGDFRDEVKKFYTGKSLEVTVDRSPTINSTGNGVSYRGMYSVLCCLNQAQTQEDVENFRMCMRLREADGPGIYHRNPFDKTRNGIDDHLYAAAASCFLESDRSVARAILNYARTHGWHFDDQNPTDPTYSTWLGRYLWFPCYLELCAGEKPSWYNRTVLSVYMLFSPKFGDTSEIIMKWFVSRVGVLSGGALSALSRRQMNKLDLMYSLGMSGAAAVYFGEQHPLSWAEVWRKIT